MKHKKIYILGLMLILFIFNNLLITSLLFLFKTSISLINAILSFILTIVIYTLIMKKEKYITKEKIINIFALTLVIITSILISGQIYDTTYDGNTYHKTAVGELKNGWNPVYETISEFNSNDSNQIELINTYETWNNHYAKGYDMYAANIYSLTNNIESGKSIYLITITATFLICFALLKSKFKNRLSILLSLLISFNPITICQLGTFYNDGLLGNFLILMIISLTLVISKEKTINQKYSYGLYFLTLVLLINIKFTGFVYAGIYSLFYYSFILFNKQKRKEHLKNITIIGITSLIIGVFLIGLSTYPKNIKTSSHPFYPLFGENKVDIMTNNTPEELRSKGVLKKFFIANFSETHNSMEKEENSYKLKMPFTFKLEELKYFIGPDVRLGGFGVLFSGILIISTLLIIYTIIKLKKEKKPISIYILPILATMFLIIILEDSWWARYLPQIYLISVVPIISLKNINIEERRKKLMTNIIVIILTLNSILILGPAFLNIITQKFTVDSSFSKLNGLVSETKLILEVPEFSGAVYNIYDKHPNIQVVNNLDDKEKYEKYNLMGSRVDILGFAKQE